MPKKISSVSSGTTRGTLANAILGAVSGSLGCTVIDNKILLDQIGFSGWYITVSVNQSSGGDNDTNTMFDLYNGSTGVSCTLSNSLSSAISSGYITSVCFFSKDSKSLILSVANATNEHVVENGYVFMAFITFDTEGIAFGGVGEKHIQSIICDRKHVYAMNFPNATMNSSGKYILCPMPNYATYTVPKSVSLKIPVTIPSFEDTGDRLFVFSIGGSRFAICDAHINEGFKTHFCPVVEW